MVWQSTRVELTHTPRCSIGPISIYNVITKTPNHDVTSTMRHQATQFIVFIMIAGQYTRDMYNILCKICNSPKIFTIGCTLLVVKYRFPGGSSRNLLSSRYSISVFCAIFYNNIMKPHKSDGRIKIR